MRDDPLRVRGDVPGPLTAVDNPDNPDKPDDPAGGLRFLPETGDTGTGGGAYLLLDAAPAARLPNADAARRS